MFRFAVVAALLIGSLAIAKKPDYPPSKIEKVTDELHGVTIADPYRWLEDGSSEAVKEWTDTQNAFTRSILDKIPEREKVRAKLDQLLDVGTVAGGVPRKGRIFYTKREGKQNQAVLYVQIDGKSKALVDPNPLAKDGTVTLDWWFPSKDGKLVAYGLSSSGNEQSTLRIHDVDAGKDLADTIERARACSAAWVPDGKGFYYTRYPKAGSVPKGDENYNRHVFFHALETDPAEDAEVFGKGRQPTDWPHVALSPDGRWLVVSVDKGWARNEVYVKDRQKNEDFFPLVENVEALFKVTPRDDRFYVLTNDGAPRFKLMAVELHKWNRKEWKEIIAEGPDLLESVAPIGGNLCALSLHQATSRLQVCDRDGKPAFDVKLPGLGSVAGLSGESEGHELFYSFQSYTQPPSIYRLDLKGKQPELWQSVQLAIDTSAFQIEQVKYASKDGTPITMFLIAKKGLEKNGKTPTVLYGYGGFNIAMTPTFNPSRFLPIVEAGGIMAIANIRGGSEYGEEWHKAGMLGKKQNVFDDFIAAAEYLIKEKYTDKDHLAIMGGSNGGLLVGSAVTQRPDLFKAAICAVPLLDMVRYHKFLIAKLWIPEYGSADDPEQFKWLYAYSPYHRVKEGTAYPAVLFTTAESDSRVDPLHARKMTALMQSASSSDRPIMLRLETKAGHGAGKPRSKILDEQTDVWSFLFDQLGVK
jgi:prolyl oligopeptidase